MLIWYRECMQTLDIYLNQMTWSWLYYYSNILMSVSCCILNRSIKIKLATLSATERSEHSCISIMWSCSSVEHMVYKSSQKSENKREKIRCNYLLFTKTIKQEAITMMYEKLINFCRNKHWLVWRNFIHETVDVNEADRTRLSRSEQRTSVLTMCGYKTIATSTAWHDKFIGVIGMRKWIE